MPANKTAEKLKIFTDVLFVLCFGALLIRMLFFGSEYIQGMPHEPNNILAFAMALLILCFILFVFFISNKIKSVTVCSFFKSPYSVFIAFAALALLQGIIVFTCYSPSGWDPQVLLNTANSLLETQGQLDYNETYFHQNPNNLFLLGVFRYFFVILNRFGITEYIPYAAFLGAILVLLSVLFLFLTVKRHFGYKIAWLLFLISAPAIALSPWVVVPYSDTYGMIFSAFCFYTYSGFKTSKSARFKYINAALFSASLVVSSFVKPYVLLFIPAVLLVELLCFFKAKGCKKAKDKNASKNSNKKIIALILLVLVLSSMFTYILCDIFVQKSVGFMLDEQKAQEESFSLTHYFMMGLSQPHGSYAYEDMQYTMSFKGSQAKMQANIDEAFRRIQNMGFTGYMSFLFRKLSFSFTDGTFFFAREGMFYAGVPPQESEFAQFVHQYYRGDGEYYNITAFLCQAQYMLLLLLMILGVFFNKHSSAKYIWLARIFTLGMVCFLLIFEARSRYVYSVLPVLYFAAIGGVLLLVNALSAKLKIRK